MTKHVLVAAFLLCAGVLTASSQTAPAAQPRMSDMMQKHQQMMTEMKAADAKLDELVGAMNAATGDAKVTAMAQVINELARQHQVMHQRMGMMDQMTMGMMGGKGATPGK
jgi:type II secretory pathway component PulM